MVTVVHSDANGVPVKVENMNSGAGGIDGVPNYEASIAAAQALAEGKSLEEANVISKAVYDSRVTANEEEEAPEEEAAQDQADEAEIEAYLQRRYLLSIAGMLHGGFEALESTELMDIACLSQRDVPNYDTWVKRRGLKN